MAYDNKNYSLYFWRLKSLLTSSRLLAVANDLWQSLVCSFITPVCLCHHMVFFLLRVSVRLLILL